MIPLLLATLAVAAPCVPTDAIKVLRGGEGDLKEAYLCVAGDDTGDDLLVASLDVTGASPSTPPSAVKSVENTAVLPAPTLDDDAIHARLTRALALWLLQHDQAVWDPALVRRLPATDRRLLSDGVRARAGRASPAPEHAKVFANFDWYKPVPNWTEGRLDETDRANIALAEKPPPAPPPAPAATEEPVLPAAAPPPPQARWCGCATGGRPGLGLGLLLAALLGWARTPRRA